MSTRVLLGTPSYRYQCDVRHADHKMMLGAALIRAGMQIGPGSFVSCPVELTRHGMMKSALASNADVLISCDADNWVTEFGQVVAAVEFMRAEGIPYIAFPSMRRNDTSNVQLLSAPGSWARKHAVLEGVHRVHSVGAAFGLMNLAVYRDRWPEGPWWRAEWAGPDDMHSEDVWHCEQLLERMGHRPLCWGGHWAKHADGDIVR